MAKRIYKARRRAANTVVRKARARCSAYVMNPEYLADASEMYFEVLRKQVSQFKNSEEGRRYMCEAMERIEARGEARGMRKGKRETMLATAKRLLANGKLMLKEIAECTGLSLAQVKKLQAEMA